MTTFGDMVYEFGGAPVGSGRYSSPWAKHYFVDGTDGKVNNGGLRPDDAMSTIQGAVDLASGGDVIYIRPLPFIVDSGFTRYEEAVTITSGIASSVFVNGNMSLIGVSNGACGDFLGVRWKETTTAAITNDAPALHVENIGFFSEGAANGILLVHDGGSDTKQGSQGTSIYNCAFKGKGVEVLSGGDGLTIEKCRFQCSSTGVTAQFKMTCSTHIGRRLTIRNCEWLDGNGTPPTSPCIYILPPCTEILIRDCFFPQEASASSCLISCAGSSNEGLLANCFFAVADLDTDLQILPGGILVVNMYDVSGRADSTN